MIRLYVLLGGNLGDKRKVFSEASAMLLEQVGKITAQSAIYETEPWGFESADYFWNQVLEFSTALSPEEVLHQTQQIEFLLGRTCKAVQYDSRIIDIDILFYGDQVIESDNLTVPHPRIQERKFVLVPLCEVAPELMHPVFHKNIQQLLSECPDPLKVERVPNIQV